MVISDGAFYAGSTWKLGNKDYHTYMCEGARNRGKTTAWLHAATERTINATLNGDDTHKFIYMRRSTVQVQMALERGLYNSCRTVHPDFYNNFGHEKVYKSKIFLPMVDGGEIHVGYCTDLNNVKGIRLEDVDVIIFDEYIELNRVDYKGGNGGLNEPELFARLLETLFGWREMWIVMLSNGDCPSNPYNEYFHIPYGILKYKDKTRGIFYEKDVAPASTRQKREISVLGKLFGGTKYNAYALGDAYAKSFASSDMICDRPSHAKLLFNVKILGKKLTIWIDDNDIEYITDDCKFNTQYPILSVTRDDMSIDTEFIAYNAAFLFAQKAYYGRGKVRFNNEATAELFYIMVGLV